MEVKEPSKGKPKEQVGCRFYKDCVAEILNYAAEL